MHEFIRNIVLLFVAKFHSFTRISPSTLMDGWDTNYDRSCKSDTLRWLRTAAPAQTD